MNGTLLSLIALVISCGVIVLLIFFYRKGVLTPEAITAAGELVEGMKFESSFLSTLSYYCSLAVQAVEQLVRSGVIPKENGPRKEAAVDYVVNYAKIDGYTLSDDDMQAVETLIEAKVYEQHTWDLQHPPEKE